MSNQHGKRCRYLGGAVCRRAGNSFLANGNIVRLGDPGNFRLSLSSTGEDASEAVTASNISSARILFTPGVMLRSLLTGLKFEKEKGFIKRFYFHPD